MPLTLPPYALATPIFRFRHIAAFAGKAQIGGAREVALACLVVIRLAADMGLEPGEDGDVRPARCAAAKSWLGTLAIPPAVRTSLTRCADASVGANRDLIAQEISGLARAVAEYLDAPSRAELDAVAVSLKA